MQIPQILTDEPEDSLRGCGLLGAYGLGLIKNFEEIFNVKISTKTITYPNKTDGEQYKILPSEFKIMYTHLLRYWCQNVEKKK